MKEKVLASRPISLKSKVPRKPSDDLVPLGATPLGEKVTHSTHSQTWIPHFTPASSRDEAHEALGRDLWLPRGGARALSGVIASSHEAATVLEARVKGCTPRILPESPELPCHRRLILPDGPTLSYPRLSPPAKQASLTNQGPRSHSCSRKPQSHPEWPRLQLLLRLLRGLGVRAWVLLPSFAPAAALATGGGPADVPLSNTPAWFPVTLPNIRI